VARIRAQVGNDRVLLGLSGGVDSSVLAALLHRAIGAQLTCVFVDHGLLRLGEGDQVMATFAEHMGVRTPAMHMYDGYVISGAIGPLQMLTKEQVQAFIDKVQKTDRVRTSCAALHPGWPTSPTARRRSRRGAIPRWVWDGR